jgi:hypothetical protein
MEATADGPLRVVVVMVVTVAVLLRAAMTMTVAAAMMMTVAIGAAMIGAVMSAAMTGVTIGVVMTVVMVVTVLATGGLTGLLLLMLTRSAKSARFMVTRQVTAGGVTLMIRGTTVIVIASVMIRVQILPPMVLIQTGTRTRAQLITSPLS